MEPLPIWIFTKDEELAVVLGDSPQGCPYYDAVLTEALNGVDKLEFSIPGDHPRAEYVVRGCIAVVQTIEGTFRAFRIKTHTQGFGEDGVRYRQFYAEDIAVDELNAAPVIDRRPNNPLDALIGALENSLWEVGQVDSGFPEASTNFYHETAMSCLQKMAETWGGEFRFRIEHDGRRITARYVDFLRQRGEDTGFRVTVGKNMRTLEGEEDITALATALYGYGRGEEHEETGGFGRRISFADVEWKKENGDPVDKPLGQEWVGDPEALAVWGLQGGTVHRFDFVIFEDVEDPEELLRLTWEELQKRKAPQVNYRVGLIDLEYTEGRSHEATRIGNWGLVIDDDFKPPLEFKARVIERKIPLRNPERTELTLGHIVPTLTDIVNRADRNSRNAIQIGDPISLLDSRFQTLTDELNRTPGFVYITPTDGLLVTDKPKDQNPTSAIRLKGGMLAIANEWDPAKGDFNWRAFGTGDGFTASMLTTGTLNANLVEITSVDVETGRERRIEIYDGGVLSYTEDYLTAAMYGYSFYVFDHGLNSDGSNTGNVTGSVRLVWTSRVDDPPDQLNARGISMTTFHEALTLSRSLPEDPGTLYESALYWNRGQQRAFVAGPTSEGDYNKFWRLQLLSQHPRERSIYDSPMIELGIGNLQGQHDSSIYCVIGDRENGGAGRHFSIYEHRNTSGNRYLAMALTPNELYLNREYLVFQQPGGTAVRGWLYATSNTLLFYKNNNNYFGINLADPSFGVVLNGTARFVVSPSGKTGGVVELSDGKTWGMSPIDSPQVLIEDVYWNVALEEEEFFVPIDRKFSEAVNGEYAVFPSRGDVEVIKKLPEGFLVRGPVGKEVDFRVIGKHRDNKDIYWVDMDEKMGPIKNAAMEFKTKLMAESQERAINNRPEPPSEIQRGRKHEQSPIKTRRRRHPGASRKSDKSNER